MTAVLDRPETPVEPPAPGPTPPSPEVATPRPSVALRPGVAAGLTSLAAAFMTGGIFGSWTARLLAGAGAALGIGLGLWACRNRRPLLIQLLLVPAAVVAGVLSTAGTAAQADVLGVVAKAINAGRVLRPPIPFDPGWRPILVIGFAFLGFGAAWIGVVNNKPRLALILPMPILVFTGMSQPAEGELLGAALCLPLLLAGLALSFTSGIDSGSRSGFELRRALRVAVGLILAVVALFGANSLGFLFPAPALNLISKPQLPKPVPLSEAKDRVLFEVRPDKGFTGPWRLGVLDVYDGTAWRIAPFDPQAQHDVGPNGVLVPGRVNDVTVGFTIRDLGDSATLPTPSGAASSTSTSKLVFDTRTEILKQPEGRAHSGLDYTVRLPKYPTDPVLAAIASPPPGFSAYLDVPPAPPEVQRLLAQSHGTPWQQFQVLQRALMSAVVSTGTGIPIPVPPARVQAMLTTNHDASPYEIVAANALMARWAGIPARVGYGFDGSNDEAGIQTVRPKNAAQWLEVNLTGAWEPIIGPPPRSKSSLSSDPTRHDPDVAPSEDLAIDVWIAIRTDTARPFEALVRTIALIALPIAAVGGLSWTAFPAFAKWRRRRRRRAWANERGPAAELAVAYANLRDDATDLGVGDPRATALEFLDLVVDDDEHAELAWLVTRVLYGDLAATVGPEESAAAQRLAASVRKRLASAQTRQVRVASVLSRLSLRQTFAPDLPGWREIRHTPIASRLRRLVPARSPA